MSTAAARSLEPHLDEQWDVVVVGAGAAGLYTALCLPEHYRVLLLTKDELRLSASDWAQGGIAAAIAPQDSAQLHIDDTLKAGAGLCEIAAVDYLVRQASPCIESLLALGVGFDRQNDQLSMTREAAHSRPRVLHAADRTGRAVVTTLAEQVLQRKNIRVLSQAFVLDLWLVEDGTCLTSSKMSESEQPSELLRCQGLGLVWQGRVQWVRAGAVVLATGGGGQVFSQTTNPTLSTGDGVAIAHRAGVQLRDLEFVQFHPTALMKDGAPHFLISEAVRGEGAHLVDDEGRRFAFDYHSDGELAPRDVVSRAIFQHLQTTGQSHVWLDLRVIDTEQVNRRFPNILRVCRHWGIDPLTEPIPVAPAAHYWMGGVTTDLQGQTSLPGLYAVGEAASTGVHGANRLASNSLLECIVFGRELSGLVLETEDALSSVDGDVAPLTGAPLDLALSEELKQQLAEWRQRLAEGLWKGAGICREQRLMADAIAQLKTWRDEFEALPLSHQLRELQPGQGVRLSQSSPEQAAVIRAWGELDNLLLVGELILESAQFRKESRGGHYRLDYPESQRQWLAHTLIEGQGASRRWCCSAPVSIS